MALLDDVKTLLDITGDELDKKLDLIIDHTTRQLMAFLPAGTEIVPMDLRYIVVEVSVARFNRIGNEGMASYSQDGQSITFADDFAPYQRAIQAWNNEQGRNGRGRIRFL